MINNKLNSGSSNFNLLVPAMISELVTDTLLIIGIMKR